MKVPVKEIPYLEVDSHVVSQNHISVLMALLYRDLRVEDDNELADTVVAIAVNRIEDGDIAADPIRQKYKLIAVNGRPLFCAYCGRLHWTQDHQALVDKAIGGNQA